MLVKERVIRSIEFKKPDRVPIWPSVKGSAWLKYGKELEAVLSQYPVDLRCVCPEKTEIGKHSRLGRWKDEWGCVWETQTEGEFGYVVEHPLIDEKNLRAFRFPKYDEVEYEKKFNNLKDKSSKQKEDGFYICLGGSSEYGVLWYRMQWLRSTEQVMIDIAEENNFVIELRDKVLESRLAYLKKILELDADGISFGDDWGTQNALMINPEKWRKIFKPAYKKLFDTVHTAGKHVFMESDGFTREIMPDWVEIGVDVLRVQLNIVGIENVKKQVRGKTCLWTDLDRQKILPFGTPGEVENYTKEVVTELKDGSGGLIGGFEIGRDVPLDNVRAVCEGFLKYGSFE